MDNWDVLFCIHSGGNTLGYGLISFQLTVDNGSSTSPQRELCKRRNSQGHITEPTANEELREQRSWRRKHSEDENKVTRN
jgi:hypothetical protein